MIKAMLTHLFLSGIFLYALPTTVKGSDSIRIHLQVHNMESGKMDLFTPTGKHEITLEEGKATVSIQLTQATELMLFTVPDVRDLGDSSIVRFIAAFTDIDVSITMKNNIATNISISGSEHHSQLALWEIKNRSNLEHIEETRKKMRAHRQQFASSHENSRFQDSLNVELNEAYGRIGNSIFAFAKNNPDSYASGYLLHKFRRQLSRDSLIKYYVQLSREVKSAKFSTLLFDELYTLSTSFRQMFDSTGSQLNNAKTIFDFTLNDENENAVDLSAFKGKPLVLFFWATWCGPCHSSANSIEDFIDTYKTDGVAFISISQDKDPEAFRNSDEKIELPCVTILDHSNTLRHFYQFTAYPTYVVLDHKGNMVHKGSGIAELEVAIVSAVANYRNYSTAKKLE